MHSLTIVSMEQPMLEGDAMSVCKYDRLFSADPIIHK